MIDRRKLGEGREAEIYEWDNGRVLRLLREPAPESRLEVEIAAMRAAAASGVPVPEVFDVVTVDGRPGFVMTRIDGPDLFSLMGRKPWTFPGAATELGTLHARLHAIAAPPELPPLHTLIRERVVAAAPLPKPLMEHALRVLATLPEGDAICHGDFHPGNVLQGAAGPMVIDWVNAARGDPQADFARTRLMLRVGALPPGTPAVIRRLDALGRSGFRHLYLRSYRRARPVAPEVVDRWEIVRAADRLSEGIVEEEPALLAVLERSAL